MNPSPHVFDASADNFPALVLENSQRGPVLVHFWTPKAGPCMVLMPRLVRLATEYGGKFLLVMVNTDKLASIARQYGVNSVPTVKFFLRGQVVQTIHGAESDQRFREALDRLFSRTANDLHAQGLAAHQRGHAEEAKKLLAAAAVDQPDNAAIPRDLAKILWANGDHEQAIALLESLPAEFRQHPELSHLHAHLSLALAAEGPAVEPEAGDSGDDDAQALFRKAAVAVAHDQMEAGFDLLMKLNADHPDFRNGLPRRALLALFDMLGSEHILVRKYRALLAQSLR